jgi:DNA-binding winged helix-turn-helix (wHTH) protein
MDTPDRDKAPASRLVFGRFALDREQDSLHSGDREVVLRHETLAVLRFLAEHPDRPIAKTELIEAAWPGLDIDDDALVQSIDELRRALGDADARVIVSLPENGYWFAPAAAPEERRKAPRRRLLRWRWVYGILAPLLLAVTVAVLMLMS